MFKLVSLLEVATVDTTVKSSKNLNLPGKKSIMSVLFTLFGSTCTVVCVDILDGSQQLRLIVQQKAIKCISIGNKNPCEKPSSIACLFVT